MSHSISTLLTRNLQDVFGENDPGRRRAAINEILTEDCVFYDPNKGVYRGRDDIDRIAGELRATHHDFRYQPIGEPEEAGNGGRVRWVEGRAGEAPTPGLISSLPGTAGLPPFISFSTSYPELIFADLIEMHFSSNRQPLPRIADYTSRCQRRAAGTIEHQRRGAMLLEHLKLELFSEPSATGTTRNQIYGLIAAFCRRDQSLDC